MQRECPFAFLRIPHSHCLLLFLAWFLLAALLKQRRQHLRPMARCLPQEQSPSALFRFVLAKFAARFSSIHAGQYHREPLGMPHVLQFIAQVARRRLLFVRAHVALCHPNTALHTCEWLRIAPQCPWAYCSCGRGRIGSRLICLTEFYFSYWVVTWICFIARLRPCSSGAPTIL
jgi:hypothetical protein